MDVLEALRGTDASLKGKTTYIFSDWTACTCGHVYQGANGTRGSEFDVKLAEDQEEESVYVQALAEVEAAAKELLANAPNPVTVGLESDRVSCRVSDHTRYVARAYNEDVRAAAIRMVECAIRRVEQRYEQNRLEVLEQAKKLNPVPLTAPAQEPVTAGKNKRVREGAPA
jgi:hypothetical protein